jgi:hypothetical protein
MDPGSSTDQASVSARDQPMNDHDPTSALPSQPATDESAYLQWKANGRTPCSRCRKLHFGPCKTPQWELDLMNRDPEEYKRHRRWAKRQRRRHNQSTTQDISAVQVSDFHQPRELQSTSASSCAQQNTPLDPGQQLEHHSTLMSSNDVTSTFLRSMVDLYRETLPRDATGLRNFTTACQHYCDTEVVDQMAAARNPPTDYDASLTSFAPSADWSGNWASGDGRLSDSGWSSGDKWLSGDWPTGGWSTDE